MANRAISVDHERQGEGRLAGCFVWMFGLAFLMAGLFLIYTLTFKPLYDVYRGRSWAEKPCVITSSKVTVHEDGDGDTYSIDMTYDYQVDGRQYSGDAYSFFETSSSGYAGKKKIVDALPKGAKTICFVNPQSPEESVLVRGLTSMALWGLFPLPFLAVGVGIIGALIYKKVSAPDENDPALTTHSRTAAQGAPDDVTQDAGIDQVPIQLRISQTARVRFLGRLAVASFWNLLLLLFLWPITEDFMMGNANWFPVLVMVPFVLVGLGLIGSTLYHALAMVNPAPVLTLSRSAIPRGESVTLSWKFQGHSESIQRLQISIVHAESATYTVGSSTSTDTETIYEDVLFAAQGVQVMATGQVEVEIPTNLMHSFEADNNKIEWAFEVHGDIPHRPDLNARFPFRVI